MILQYVRGLNEDFLINLKAYNAHFIVLLPPNGKNSNKNNIILTSVSEWARDVIFDSSWKTFIEPKYIHL